MDIGDGSRPPLAWAWVVGLSLAGSVFGVLTIFGLVAGHERWLILSILFLCALILAIVVEHSPSRHGLATGFLLGLQWVWSQALFMDTYLENNPAAAAVEIPFGWSPRPFTWIFGPLNAVLAALMVALVTWCLFRLRDRFLRLSDTESSSR